MIIISSIPNLAFRVDNSPFYDRLFVKTEEEKKYNSPFTIHTAPGNSYFKSTVEYASRNTIVPMSIGIVNKNRVLFIFWSLSFLLLLWVSLKNEKYKKRSVNPRFPFTASIFNR
jgi:hypothetical protein